MASIPIRQGAFDARRMSKLLVKRLRDLGYELALAEDAGSYCEDFKLKQEEHRKLLRRLYK